MSEDRDNIRQELAMNEAMKLQGLKQMNDMCEWLEMESSVSFDWYKWVDSYEECPVEDYHQLEGDHKALFVQMINACPNFDACLEAWLSYSLVTGNELTEDTSKPLCDSADLSIRSVEKDRNVYLNGKYKGHDVAVLVNLGKHGRIDGRVTVRDLSREGFDGMAVWVDGVLDFMWGYPNLGPNGYMPATETPA